MLTIEQINKIKNIKQTPEKTKKKKKEKKEKKKEKKKKERKKKKETPKKNQVRDMNPKAASSQAGPRELQEKPRQRRRTASCTPLCLARHRSIQSGSGVTCSCRPRHRQALCSGRGQSESSPGPQLAAPAQLMEMIRQDHDRCSVESETRPPAPFNHTTRRAACL